MNGLPVKVGVLDTGCMDKVAARMAFHADGDAPWPVVAPGDHGNRIAMIIRAACPQALLYDARALAQGFPGSAAQIVEALDWLVDQQVHIINMSIGLQQNRRILADAVHRASDQGILLVASAPALGAPVYPAAYADVLAVTGDARCDAGVFSTLASHHVQAGSQPLDFGAAPGGPHHRAHTRGLGASFACAHVSARLAQLWLASPAGTDIVARLHQECTFRARECRH